MPSIVRSSQHAAQSEQTPAVGAEMKKMIGFILQEALEKAREINIRAEEEFQIEKAKMVQKGTSQLESTHERKLKALQTQLKM